MRKGEIAVFERLVLQTRKNQGLFGKGLTKIMWESSKCLGKNIVWRADKRTFRKAWIGALAALITNQNNVETGIKHP